MSGSQKMAMTSAGSKRGLVVDQDQSGDVLKTNGSSEGPTSEGLDSLLLLR